MLKQKNYDRKLGMQTTTIVGIAILLFVIVLYIYFIRTGQAQHVLAKIRGLGPIGMILGVLCLTLLNVIPVPAEFVSIFLMEIYGV